MKQRLPTASVIAFGVTLLVLMGLPALVVAADIPAAVFFMLLPGASILLVGLIRLGIAPLVDR